MRTISLHHLRTVSSCIISDTQFLTISHLIFSEHEKIWLSVCCLNTVTDGSLQTNQRPIRNCQKLHIKWRIPTQRKNICICQRALRPCSPPEGLPRLQTQAGPPPPHKVQQSSHLPPNHSSALPTFNLREYVVTWTRRQLTADTNISCSCLTVQVSRSEKCRLSPQDLYQPPPTTGTPTPRLVSRLPWNIQTGEVHMFVISFSPSGFSKHLKIRTKSGNTLESEKTTKTTFAKPEQTVELPTLSLTLQPKTCSMKPNLIIQCLVKRDVRRYQQSPVWLQGDPDWVRNHSDSGWDV